MSDRSSADPADDTSLEGEYPEADEQHESKADTDIVKVKPSVNSQSTPSFSSTMSMEQVKESLVRVFYKPYEQNAISEDTISDYLSVRKLRVIVRALKLSDVSESSIRKPVLCSLLHKYLLRDDMVARYKRHSEDKERAAKLRAEKRAEKLAAKAAVITEREPPKLREESGRLRSRQSISYGETDENIGKEKKTETRKGKSDHTDERRENFHTAIRNATLSIKPQTVSDSTDALAVLSRVNKMIWEISARVTELERAVSVLVIRINEAERTFM